MKKIFMALLVLGIFALSVDSMAIPQNLPHHNNNDVDDTLRVFIPYTAFSLNSTSGALASFTSSAAVVNYITTQAVAGIKITGSGQSIPLMMQLPDNLCVDCQVKVSVVWSTNSLNTNNTATWQVLYSDVPLLGPFKEQTDALNTAITSDTVDNNAFGFNETPLGIINASTFTRGDAINILASLLSTSGLDPFNDTILFHGINLYYVREKI